MSFLAADSPSCNVEYHFKRIITVIFYGRLSELTKSSHLSFKIRRECWYKDSQPKKGMFVITRMLGWDLKHHKRYIPAIVNKTNKTIEDLVNSY